MASTYLTRTISTASNRRTWTWSAWIKRSDLTTGYQTLFSSDVDSNNMTRILFWDTQQLTVSSKIGGSFPIDYRLTRIFRDPSAWYHIVVAMDTTQATDTNRLKIYINGVLETAYEGSSSSLPSQNEDTWINSTNPQIVGKSQTYNGLYGGSMSHIHFIDGTAYDASYFGSTDSTTGEWKINTSPSVTYGTNGFFILKDGNSVTDQSGRGNNFAVGGGTLTKTEDCPDNVFSTCSKEPMRRLSGTYVKPVLSNGNTTWDATGADVGATVTLSNLGATTGKYYMEAKVGGSYADSSRIGVGTHENYNGTTFFNSTSSNYVSYTANGEKNIAGTTSSYGASYTVGDIISVALDCDNNTVTFYKNGASQGAINIANNDNFKHFSCGGYDATGSNITNWICNFGNGYFGTTAVSSAGTNASGNGIFEFDVPTGYTALSTKGLNL